MLMMLVTPRFLVAVTVLSAVTVMVSGLQPTEEKEEIILHPYRGGEDIESTWTFLRSVPGKSDDLTRDLMPYEWLIFNQTNPLLKSWRLVTMTRRVPNTTLEEAHGQVEPTYPVPPMMELSTWNFDDYNTTTYKQSETDPLLKRWRLVYTTRPVMMNIQSMGVHQNLSETDITPGEVRGQVESNGTVPSMKSTWTFLHSVPGKSDNLTRDLMPYEWLVFNQTNPLLKRWRLVFTTRPVPETTLGEAHGRVEPTHPVLPTMEPLTWYFDYYYATRYKQPLSATWKFIGKNPRNSNNATYDVKLRDYLIFNQTDPLLKRWRLVVTNRPVMMNIQSVGVHQNSSEPDITPGEVHGSVEPTDTVLTMKEPSTGNFGDNAIPGTQSESTWTFLRSFPGISDNLTRDLMPFEWLVFNQTNTLLKRWKLVFTTRPVPETTLGEAHGRVEPTHPVLPTMERLTWYFDYCYDTPYRQHLSATWKIIGTKYRNSNNGKTTTPCVKLRDYLIFNQTDPLLKRWRLVITTRPVMMNIQSVGLHQNSSEPDIAPGEVHGSVEPKDTVLTMKKRSTGNFDDHAIPGTQSETREIENTMEHNHQENEQQIDKTGDAINSTYQMKVEENKSKIKFVRPYPLERDFM